MFQNARKCFLSDGASVVDYVLVYDDDQAIREENKEEEKREFRIAKERKAEKRMAYERNLQSLGLTLERKNARFSEANYVLINAPYEVLAKQAEFMQIKLPVRAIDMNDESRISQFVSKIFRWIRLEPLDHKEPEYFSEPFQRDHLDLFLNSADCDNFFPQAERCRMVYELMVRTRYDNSNFASRNSKNLTGIGIESLIADGTYSAAFPIHQALVRGEVETKLPREETSDRQILYDNWARVRKFYKLQPLGLIKRYFGTKIALYYAWLGFYTKWLFPASLIGVICVLFGVANLSQDIPSNDICGTDGIGKDIIMCPTCDTLCDFWHLNTSCAYAKISYVVDNGATVIFAAAMSIWATIFLECWKRYHAKIAFKWDLLDHEIEELLLVMGFTFGIVMYRVILLSVLHTKEYFFKANAALLTTITAAIINLIFILVMSNVYYILALKLTDWECPRTQADFESSYTFKLFLFNFVNYYSSLFYIAFVKGKVSGVPGAFDREHGRFRLWGYRLEDCDPSGCMAELVIQLAIIMCGRQFLDSLVEVIAPLACTWFRRWRNGMPPDAERRKRKARLLKMESASGIIPRWEHDYCLFPVYPLFLFDEYLEMVLQFGFVTLFVSAFPLAPLFAFIHNIFEIRLDAWKMLVTTQRPLPARTRNMGIWFPILEGVSKACIIAFTSDFVPKMLYVLTNDWGNLKGYVNSSLSFANSSLVKPDNQYPNSLFLNVTVPLCRFRDYRKPPCGLFTDRECDDEYGFSFEFWHILAARLAFVLIFEHVVYIIKGLFAYMIPDMPTAIFLRLQRERYLARKARMRQGTNDLNNIEESIGHGGGSERGGLSTWPFLGQTNPLNESFKL